MPHFVVEYSANLEQSVDLQSLAILIRDAAVASGVFPLAGIRVRFHRCDVYEIADGAEQNSFIHLVLRMGAGRDLPTRQQAGQQIFSALKTHFDVKLSHEPFALSLEIVEIDADLNFKQNGIRNHLSSPPE